MKEPSLQERTDIALKNLFVSAVKWWNKNCPVLVGSLKPLEGMKDNYFSITIHFLQISTFHNSVQSMPGAPRLCSWFVTSAHTGCGRKYRNIRTTIALAAGFTSWMFVEGQAGASRAIPQGGVALLGCGRFRAARVWHQLYLYGCVVLSLCHCPHPCHSCFRSVIPPGALSWHCGQTSLSWLRDLCWDLATAASAPSFISEVWTLA